MLTFAEALAALGADGETSRDNVYWAARATLVRRPEDLPVFDRAFKVFFDAVLTRGGTDEVHEPQRITIETDDGTDDDSTQDQDDPVDPRDDPTIQLRFSAQEVLRHKDFGAYSDDELRLAQQLMTRLRFAARRAARCG